MISPDNFSMRSGRFMPTASAGHAPPLFILRSRLGLCKLTSGLCSVCHRHSQSMAHPLVQGDWRLQTRFNEVFSTPWRESDPHFLDSCGCVELRNPPTGRLGFEGAIRFQGPFLFP
jgi:hypothetical protein